MELDLFYTARSEEFKKIITEKLQNVFNGLKIRDGGKLNIFEGAWNPARKQYDSYMLLDYLIRRMDSGYSLWVIDKDIYCDKVNFVFGLAMYHIAGIVSIHRLDSSQMVAKEAVHEVGHVLGLRHCNNRCVMQFSNTLEEASRKPDTICDRCRKLLDRKVIEQGQLS